MLHRYRIRPLSPLITPLMSDTFFGHFCWALVYSKTEAFLADFLMLYENGTQAPVLFSAAFPEGTLPRPALPPLARERIKALVGDRFGADKQHCLKGHATVKKLLKQSHLSLELWQQLKDGYNPAWLIEQLLKTDQPAESASGVEESATCNTISRETGSVSEESGLFQRNKLWYNPDARFDLYAETADEEYARLVQWFLIEFLPEYGFGADKTVGMGNLDIEPDAGFDPAPLLAVDGPNARLSLSSAAFPGIEAFEASYRLKTKFGRLGGNFAFSSPTGGSPQPFKKPVLMFEPGAVFFTSENLNTRPLLSGVHTDERIRHCGIPITLPFKFSEV